MTRTDKINVIGWIGVVIAVLSHFGAMLWFGRGLYDQVEHNTIAIQANRESGDTLTASLLRQNEKVWTLTGMEKDIDAMKQDLKELKLYILRQEADARSHK